MYYLKHLINCRIILNDFEYKLLMYEIWDKILELLGGSPNSQYRDNR